jgi:branched-chain amino acid transport system substrate-binding protein
MEGIRVLMRVTYSHDRAPKNLIKGASMLVKMVVGILVIGLLSAPAFAAEAIKIGSMNALSGPFGVLGVDQSKATKLAVDHINKDGGILGRKVEILIRDDETSPATAARVGRKLILEDKVNFIVGVNGSPAAMSVSELANRFKIPFLSSGGAMVEAMTGKDCNKYTFRINHLGAQFYRADAAYVASNWPDVKTIAGINPDYSFGREMWEGFLNELKKRRPDIKLVADVFVPMTEKDYTNYISAVIDKKPDLVYSVFWSGTGVAFIKQAKPYGLFEKTKFFLAAAAIGTSLIVMEKDMARMWGSEPYVFEIDTPMNKRFVADFMKENGKPPHSYCAHSYGTVMILKQAIEKAKSVDPDKVVAALEGGTFDAPWGKTLVRKGDHQAMGKIYIGEAKPNPKYPFWTLSDLKVIPAEEVSVPENQTGCVFK